MNALTNQADFALPQKDNIFIHYDIENDDDFEISHLAEGQTLWVRPHSSAYAYSPAYLIRQAVVVSTTLAAELAPKGRHFSIRVVGEFVRVRRLTGGPVRKLSDWKQLNVGQSMLIDPRPSTEATEKALTRIQYLQQKRLGLFSCWTDDKGGLWVQRHTMPS